MLSSCSDEVSTLYFWKSQLSLLVLVVFLSRSRFPVVLRLGDGPDDDVSFADFFPCEVSFRAELTFRTGAACPPWPGRASAREALTARFKCLVFLPILSLLNTPLSPVFMVLSRRFSVFAGSVQHPGLCFFFVAAIRWVPCPFAEAFRGGCVFVSLAHLLVSSLLAILGGGSRPEPPSHLVTAFFFFRLVHSPKVFLP